MTYDSLDMAYRAFLHSKEVYCSNDTVDFYRDNVSQFLIWCVKNNITELHQLDHNVINNYILHLKAKKIRNTSVNTYLRAVTVFCSWLYQTQLLDFNPAGRVKRLKSDAPEIIPLMKDEVIRLDSYFLPRKHGLRNYCIFHLMLDCGLRLKEVIGLAWNDLDLTHHLVSVCSGKGFKSRVVPLPEFLAVRLAEYFRQSRHSDLLVFHCSENSIKQLFTKAKKLPGLNRVHAHLCRHTFATSFMLHNGNIELCRMLLGHSDYSVTQRYLHLASVYSFAHFDVYRIDRCFFHSLGGSSAPIK